MARLIKSDWNTKLLQNANNFDYLKFLVNTDNTNVDFCPSSKKSRHFIPNGLTLAYIGMIAEVITSEVDTSAAAFINNLERNEVVDFTQGILKVVETLVIKTPTKSDQVSFLTRKYENNSVSQFI